MVDILLFGGTTEGRLLSEALKKKGIPAMVCVATEYGESLLEPGGSLQVHAERLDENAMAALMERERPRLVLDATHPYADDVRCSIQNACAATGREYRRVRRESQMEADCLSFPDMAALIDWLSGQEGVIFSSLGSKEARALAAVPGSEGRVWLRILPSQKGLADCLCAGFPARHIICMQGPFSRELNEAMFRTTGASILITKESGRAGGFAEKLAAARNCGMTVAVLARPQDAEGDTAAEWLRRIEEGTI